MKYLGLMSALLLTQSLLAKNIEVGIASNFSQVSISNSNPFNNSFREGVLLALDLNKPKSLSVAIELIEFDYGVRQEGFEDFVGLQSKSEVIAVVGYNLSTQALLAAPSYNKLKLPVIITSATANRLGSIGRYIHLTSPSNSNMGETMANLAIDKLKSERPLVILVEDCAYCTDLHSSFANQYAKRKNIKPPKIGVLESETEFKNILESTELKQSDLVVLPNYELISARIAFAVLNSGKKVKFLGGDGWGDNGQGFFKITGKSKFEGYALSHWSEVTSNPEAIRFASKFKLKYGKPPNDTAALAYDSMSLLLEALSKSPEFSREALENTLNQIKSFPGASGTLHFPSKNTAPLRKFILLKFKNGTVEPVKE